MSKSFFYKIIDEIYENVLVENLMLLVCILKIKTEESCKTITAVKIRDNFRTGYIGSCWVRVRIR